MGGTELISPVSKGKWGTGSSSQIPTPAVLSVLPLSMLASETSKIILKKTHKNVPSRIKIFSFLDCVIVKHLGNTEQQSEHKGVVTISVYRNESCWNSTGSSRAHPRCTTQLLETTWPAYIPHLLPFHLFEFRPCLLSFLLPHKRKASILMIKFKHVTIKFYLKTSEAQNNMEVFVKHTTIKLTL